VELESTTRSERLSLPTPLTPNTRNTRAPLLSPPALISTLPPFRPPSNTPQRRDAAAEGARPRCCTCASIIFGIVTVVCIVLVLAWGGSISADCIRDAKANSAGQQYKGKIDIYIPTSCRYTNYGYNSRYDYYNYDYYGYNNYGGGKKYISATDGQNCDRDWDLTCKVAEANPSPATYNNVTDTVRAVPNVTTDCACLSTTSTYYLSHKILARSHLGCNTGSHLVDKAEGDFRARFTFDKHVVEPSKYRSVAGPPGNTTSAAAGFTLSEPWAIRWLSRWAEGAFRARATAFDDPAPRVLPGWDVQYAPSCFVSEACGAAVWKGLSGGDESGYPTDALKTRPSENKYPNTQKKRYESGPCAWFVAGTAARDTCDKDLVAMKQAGFHWNYLSSTSDSSLAGDAQLVGGVWSRVCTKLSHCSFAAVDVSHTGFEANCKVHSSN
jgi:hypothetical protein